MNYTTPSRPAEALAPYASLAIERRLPSGRSRAVLPRRHDGSRDRSGRPGQGDLPGLPGAGGVPGLGAAQPDRVRHLGRYHRGGPADPPPGVRPAGVA